MSQQREIIYKQRDEVLESENLRDIVENMIKIGHRTHCSSAYTERKMPEEWDLQAIVDYVNANFLP